MVADARARLEREGEDLSSVVKEQLFKHLVNPRQSGIGKVVHKLLMEQPVGGPALEKTMKEVNAIALGCGLSKFDNTSCCVVKTGHFSTAFPICHKINRFPDLKGSDKQNVYCLNSLYERFRFILDVDHEQIRLAWPQMIRAPKEPKASTNPRPLKMAKLSHPEGAGSSSDHNYFPATTTTTPDSPGGGQALALMVCPSVLELTLAHLTHWGSIQKARGVLSINAEDEAGSRDRYFGLRVFGTTAGASGGMAFGCHR